MARVRSGGRSSRDGYIYTSGPRLSGVYGGSDDGPALSFKERMMQLPLEERCSRVSVLYAKFMRDSDLFLAAKAKKAMVGCPERYFDVDSVPAECVYSSSDDGPVLSFQERMMQLPLEERCSRVSVLYAKFMRDSDLFLAAKVKKAMVGCPERCFDVDSVAAANLL